MAWKKALSDEAERRLVVDHEDGFKVVQLVGRYGISESTVYRILADYKAKRTIHPQRRRKPLRAAAKGREVLPCGTNAAYSRHKRNGTQPCLACSDAHATEQKRWSDERKANAVQDLGEG